MKTMHAPVLYSTGYRIHYRYLAPYYKGCLKDDDKSALLLPGGGDVSPDLYGMTMHPSMYGVNKQYDLYELQALREAITHRRPVLAICRGHQLTAVHFGAKLIQDISPPHPDKHPLTFLSSPTDDLGKKIFTLLQQHCTYVNSIHHQGVAMQHVPQQAVCLAHHENVVEALWYPKYRIVSVQFHPEWMGSNGLSFIYDVLTLLTTVQ